MGLFRAAHRCGCKKAPLSKICQTYPTMMKLGTVTLYVKRSKNCMNHVTHPLSSADISFFSPEISNFYYVKNTNIDSFWYIISIFFSFTFFESLKVILTKMVINLLMSAKLATLSFWGYLK